MDDANRKLVLSRETVVMDVGESSTTTPVLAGCGGGPERQTAERVLEC